MKIEPGRAVMPSANRGKNRERNEKMTVITESDLVPRWTVVEEDDGGRWGLLLRRADNICAQHEVHYFRDEIYGPVTFNQEHFYLDAFPQSFSSEKDMLSFIRGLLKM